MPVEIVQLLKAVHIDHQQRKSLLGSNSHLPLSLQHFVKVTTVVDFCKAVSVNSACDFRYFPCSSAARKPYDATAIEMQANASQECLPATSIPISTIARVKITGLRLLMSSRIDRLSPGRASVSPVTIGRNASTPSSVRYGIVQPTSCRPLGTARASSR